MGRFVKHTQCPKCAEKGKDRKGNNLGVYEDGSAYCFSCGYVVGHCGGFRSKSDSLLYVRERSRQVGPTSISTVSSILPDDVVAVYPSKCLTWIKQYELSVEDLYANRCLWSNVYSRLIFPYYSAVDNSLLGWQGRYFGEEAKPKWFSRGDLSTIYHIFNQESAKHFLVLVEDVVSSIKLGKASIPVMPIFGSHISSKAIERLKLVTDRLIIWLDPDKRKESMKFANAANVLGLPTSVVLSDRDPKEESFPFIKEKFDNLLNSCYNINTRGADVY